MARYGDPEEIEKAEGMLGELQKVTGTKQKFGGNVDETRAGGSKKRR